MPQIGRVVADHRGVDAVPLRRREYVLDSHRALALPGRRRLLLRRIDMGVEVDDHDALLDGERWQLLRYPLRLPAARGDAVDGVAVDPAAIDAKPFAEVDHEADVRAVEPGIAHRDRMRLDHLRKVSRV